VYAAGDVLVHPTWHDPCSLVCLEAASMGLPVVTTPADGFSELMGRRAGIVVEEPGNAAAVATAIAVLADPRLRAETAEDARYLARSNRLATRLDQVLDVCRGAAAR
jgi:UDP-glucose:(heptosyl)LPS alpha-1,3-glucosyltransferase